LLSPFAATPPNTTHYHYLPVFNNIMIIYQYSTIVLFISIQLSLLFTSIQQYHDHLPVFNNSIIYQYSTFIIIYQYSTILSFSSIQQCYYLAAFNNIII